MQKVYFNFAGISTVFQGSKFNSILPLFKILWSPKRENRRRERRTRHEECAFNYKTQRRTGAKPLLKLQMCRLTMSRRNSRIPNQRSRIQYGLRKVKFTAISDILLLTLYPVPFPHVREIPSLAVNILSSMRYSFVTSISTTRFGSRDSISGAHP